MIDINNFSNAPEILLEKGKKAAIGEVRDWGGVKWKKEVQGWVQVGTGETHTKKEEDDVDTSDVKKEVERKVSKKNQPTMLSIAEGNKHYAHVRDSHSSESLTDAVKSVIAEKGNSEQKAIKLYKMGLHLHEIVNCAGTPLSSTIWFINQANNNGEFRDGKQQDIPQPSNESKGSNKKEEKSEEPKLLPSWLEDLPESDYTVNWDTYKNMINQVALGQAKGGFFYGTGGVGKTYTMNKQLSALGLRKGNVVIAQEDNANTETHDSDLIDDFSEDSIYGKDEQSGRMYIKKDKYDFIKITGKISPVKMFQLMQEHNGKMIIFDDCDQMLKDENCVNLLKGAIDTGAAEPISWNTQGIPKSDFAGIKGSKAVTDKQGNITHYELPKSFTFSGQIMWISNLPQDKVPQPLVSRCDMVDLTMSRKETIDKIETDIVPNAEFYEKDGVTKFSVSDSSKQKGFQFMKDVIDLLDQEHLNGRTFIKIARYIENNEKAHVPYQKTLQQLANTYIPKYVKKKTS